MVLHSVLLALLAVAASQLPVSNAAEFYAPELEVGSWVYASSPLFMVQLNAATQQFIAAPCADGSDDPEAGGSIANFRANVFVAFSICNPLETSAFVTASASVSQVEVPSVQPACSTLDPLFYIVNEAGTCDKAIIGSEGSGPVYKTILQAGECFAMHVVAAGEGVSVASPIAFLLEEIPAPIEVQLTLNTWTYYSPSPTGWSDSSEGSTVFTPITPTYAYRTSVCADGSDDVNVGGIFSNKASPYVPFSICNPYAESPAWVTVSSSFAQFPEPENAVPEGRSRDVYYNFVDPDSGLCIKAVEETEQADPGPVHKIALGAGECVLLYLTASGNMDPAGVDNGVAFLLSDAGTGPVIELQGLDVDTEVVLHVPEGSGWNIELPSKTFTDSICSAGAFVDASPLAVRTVKFHYCVPEGNDVDILVSTEGLGTEVGVTARGNDPAVYVEGPLGTCVNGGDDISFEDTQTRFTARLQAGRCFGFHLLTRDGFDVDNRGPATGIRFSVQPAACVRRPDCYDGDPCTVNTCEGNVCVTTMASGEDCVPCSLASECPRNAGLIPCQRKACVDSRCEYPLIPNCVSCTTSAECLPVPAQVNPCKRYECASIGRCLAPNRRDGVRCGPAKSCSQGVCVRNT